MSETKECYLVVNGKDEETRVLLHFLIKSQTVINALYIEVEAYNNHLQLLAKGLAPASCYVSDELRHELCLSGHRLFYEKVTDVSSRRIDYPVGLLLVVDGKTSASHEFTFDREMEESDMDKIKSMSPSFDREFFNDKFDGEKWTMGFGILPITRMLAPNRRSSE